MPNERCMEAVEPEVTVTSRGGGKWTFKAGMLLMGNNLTKYLHYGALEPSKYAGGGRLGVPVASG